MIDQKRYRISDNPATYALYCGAVEVAGVGLHGGHPAVVVLRRATGPVVLADAGREVRLCDVRVVAVDHATTIEFAGRRLATVEHLFAACAAMGIFEGLAIDVRGDELPLLDGGATLWCDALAELGVPASAPSLVVHRDGIVELGSSRYSFERGEGRRLEVEVDYADARIDGRARWDGDPDDFRARIAPARTFALFRDLTELEQRGLAAQATPESVVLICPDAILHAGRDFRSDEPAKHKLLDLAGDLYIYGGPPQGRVIAVRPGHAVTHEAMRIALERGLVGPR
jgi:UDP-3-O-[3-hydroxymyristoyl] N-acetylglucosamine deacetylase